MKTAISNIGWAAGDEEVYALMKKYGYSGLELAPARIFPENPYDHLEEAESWSRELKSTYGFSIPSMQSIWFGRQENIFGSQQERKTLIHYTKKAIDFAAAVKCTNLVFGCPRNRNLPQGADPDIAIPFFKELGDYADQKGTVLGMEANPPIYHTNYINDTQSALDLIKAVNSKGFLLNLDTGTMIQNREHVEALAGNVRFINHVHISEPGLKPIEERKLHQELYKLLTEEEYQNYISIEMGKTDDCSIIDETLQYIKQVFNHKQ